MYDEICTPVNQNVKQFIANNMQLLIAKKQKRFIYNKNKMYA